MIMLFSGFLVSIGVFDWRFVYPILLLGDLFGDFVWYSIGYFGAQKTINKVGTFFRLDLSILPRLEVMFNNKKGGLFFSRK